MPKLNIITDDSHTSITFDGYQNLRDLLDKANYRIRTGCRGNGACGLCKIKVLKGTINEPLQNELVHLRDEQISQGIRLACQVEVSSDTTVFIESSISDFTCKRLHDIKISFPFSPCSNDVKDSVSMAPYACAVDIGTTNICISIFALDNGKWLTHRIGPNPQMSFGTDVITRLLSATESHENAKKLENLIIDAIADALLDIAKVDGIDIRQIINATISGNTAMIALLSGRGYDLLLQPENWTCYIDCLPTDTRQWINKWCIHPEANVNVIGPLAGFVGSDFILGIIATSLIEREYPAIFIDFGTNSEIGLWDGRTLWVTSAAGGPAFELSGISCGMPADSGAIYRVYKDLSFEVIDNTSAKGLCGSGFVDLVACLRHVGKLLPTGSFSSDIKSDSFTIAKTPKTTISIKKSDIDAFAKAKSAIAAGLKVLVKIAGLSLNDIDRLCIAGEFGKFLDIGHSQSIGLLPPMNKDKVYICGNTSLLGCKTIALCSHAGQVLQDIVMKSKIINLALEKDFEDYFFENLYLMPMQG